MKRCVKSASLGFKSNWVCPRSIARIFSFPNPRSSPFRQRSPTFMAQVSGHRGVLTVVCPQIWSLWRLLVLLSTWSDGSMADLSNWIPSVVRVLDLDLCIGPANASWTRLGIMGGYIKNVLALTTEMMPCSLLDPALSTIRFPSYITAASEIWKLGSGLCFWVSSFVVVIRCMLMYSQMAETVCQRLIGRMIYHFISFLFNLLIIFFLFLLFPF